MTYRVGDILVRERLGTKDHLCVKSYGLVPFVAVEGAIWATTSSSKYAATTLGGDLKLGLPSDLLKGAEQ